MKVKPFTLKFNAAKSKAGINKSETAKQKSYQTDDSVSFTSLSDKSNLKIAEVHHPNEKSKASKLSLLGDFAMESLNTAIDLTRFFVTTYGCIALETLRTPRQPSNTSEKSNNTNILKSNLKTDELSAMTDSFAYAMEGLKQEIKDTNQIPPFEMQIESQSVSATMPIALVNLPYQPIDSRFIKDIEASGPQGKTILTGRDHIEDQAILSWVEKDLNRETYLNFKCRLTLQGNKQIMNNIENLKESSIEKGPSKVQRKNPKAGSIELTGEMVPLPRGTYYNIALDNDITLSYTPHVENYKKSINPDIAPFSSQRFLTLRMKCDKVEPKTIEKVLSKLKEMGLNTTLSTPMDLEYEYLSQMAFAAKLDTPAFMQNIRSISESADRVNFMKGYLSAKMDVEDVSKTKGYDWRPKFDHLCNPQSLPDLKSSAGWPRWNRFDASLYVDTTLKDYHLVHNVYAPKGQLGELTSRIIRSTLGLYATEERFTRLGIITSGISSDKDRLSGGANYVFTHLDKKDNGTFVFSKDLLKRTDQIAYRPGMFGHTLNNSLDRRTTIDKYHRSPIYEVMFKNNISFLDYLEKINMPSEEERQQVIEAFYETGISEVRNIKIEDLVVANKDSHKR